MWIKESPYIYLQFYRDQVLLGTNNAGQEYHTLLAGRPESKTNPREIRIYAPLPPEKKPAKSEPVLKYAEKALATLNVQATISGE